METKKITIDVPTITEILVIECYDANGSFFSKSLTLVELLGEDKKEEIAGEVKKEEKETE